MFRVVDQRVENDYFFPGGRGFSQGSSDFYLFSLHSYVRFDAQV
jgi:hypothetical protein